MSIREIARAKINLTLEVHGRRPDGYHALTSLVTFAGLGDTISFEPGAPERITVSGPFADEIAGENLLARTLAVLRTEAPALTLGAVHLEKTLPVAAGIGGGSADAAALLRAVRSANGAHAQAVDWNGIAARLGADIPVCLANVPAVMWGKGERLEPVTRLPSTAAVLVNPRRPLETAKVFAALAAAPLGGDGPRAAPLPEMTDSAALVAYIRARGNSLERPAISLLPVIADMKSALERQAGCLLAAMSGSGPTCFGVFTDAHAASKAAAALSSDEPDWWVAATEFAGAG
jgi:4-diphosphocytidyl-2-C-methyl-D-erythritol kinase